MSETQLVKVEGRWRPRFALAALVRVIAYGVPLASGSSAAWLVSRELTGAQHRVLATVTVLGSAVVVSLLMSRLTMKLMPLAVLLRMTMIFPDRAPSRVKVARLSNSATDISRRLHSSSTDESEAAMAMLSLVTALGRHDRRTRGHSERVRLFCDLLADELKLSDSDAGRLRWAALIHDVGKLEIPEQILNKPAELSEDEWEVVRRHPLDGARLARPLERWLGPWFAGIAHHHERWDGSGYPVGLSGERISSAGRAIAVVDAFETMTSARAYKNARSTMSARTELALCAGSHFDPAMVRAFLGISLPKLLWSVGPLAFLVNVPYLRWAVEGGVRTAEVATAATAATANAAGATVVAVAVGAMPSSAASAVPNLPELTAQVQSGASTSASGSGSGSDAGVAEVPLGTFTVLADGAQGAVVTASGDGPFLSLQLGGADAAEHADDAPGQTKADAGKDGAPGQTKGGPGKENAPGQTRLDQGSSSGKGSGSGKDNAPGQSRPDQGSSSGKGKENAPGQTKPGKSGDDSSSSGKGSGKSADNASSSGKGSGSSGKGSGTSGDSSSSSGKGSGGSSSASEQGSSSGSSGKGSSGKGSSGKGSSASGSSGSSGKGSGKGSPGVSND